MIFLLIESLDKLEIANKESEFKANLNNKNPFFQRLQTLQEEFIQLSKHSIDNLSKDEHQAIISLSKDYKIVISKVDKGNSVVIQNKKDFTE